MKPHVWIMARPLSPLVPVCRYCYISSLEAQRTQPESKGVGPCPKAPA